MCIRDRAPTGEETEDAEVKEEVPAEQEETEEVPTEEIQPAEQQVSIQAMEANGVAAVSYTHLDVYKRQSPGT